MRADLRVFEPVFDSAWLDATKTYLAGIARVAGQARDLDVIIDRLESSVNLLSASDQHGVDVLRDRLRAERHNEFIRIVDALAGEGRPGVEHFVRSLEVAPPSPHAELVIVRDLVAATGRQWQRLRSAARRAAETATDDTLHRVRIRAKNLRYSLDTLAPVLHSSARAHVKSLAALQDHLGQVQDAFVVERWLREHGTASADSFVLGELVGIERARRAQLIDEWRGVWRRAARPRLRRWAR
jgi:CHAD domain-containing protein